MAKKSILGSIANALFGGSTPRPSTTSPLARLATARATPLSGFQLKTTPKGRQFTSLVVNRNARHNPTKTLQTARAVAQRAQQTAGRATAIAAARGAKKPGAKNIIGAGATRHPKLSVLQLKQQAVKLAAAGKALGETANKYETNLSTLRTKSAAGTKRAQQATRIHGISYFNDIVGEWQPGGGGWQDIVGAIAAHHVTTAELLGDLYGAPVPDPLRPGLLTDGSPDPSFGGGASTTPDANSGATAAGPPDYGAGAPPDMASVAPMPGLDYMPDPYPNGPDPTFYDCPTKDSLPLGAIPFDGSHQPGFMGLGSTSTYYGTVPGLPPPKGGPFSGFSLHDDGWWLLLQGTQPSTGYSGGRNYDKVDEPGYAMVAESQKNNWGPLIGAPSIAGTSTPSWTRGLRFSPSGPNGPFWFWYYDMAPDWAKQPILQALLNDAIVAYKAAVTAGQTDYINQALQDQLDAQTAAQQAREQGAQDAQLGRQQQAQDAQQAAYEQQYQQQQATMEQQQQAQQAQFEASAQQAQLAYFQQHPEAMFAPAADEGGSEGDGGGGWQQAVPSAELDWGDDANIDWGDDDGGTSSDELVGRINLR